MRESEVNNKMNNQLQDAISDIGNISEDLPEIPASFSEEYMNMMQGMLPDSDLLWKKIEAGLDETATGLDETATVGNKNAENKNADNRTSSNNKKSKLLTWKPYYGTIIAAGICLVVGVSAFVTIVSSNKKASAPTAVANESAVMEAASEEASYSDAASETACEEDCSDSYETDYDEAFDEAYDDTYRNLKGDSLNGMASYEEAGAAEAPAAEAPAEAVDEEVEEAIAEEATDDFDMESEDDEKVVVLDSNVLVLEITYLYKDSSLQKVMAVNHLGEEIILIEDEAHKYRGLSEMEAGVTYEMLLIPVDLEENVFYVKYYR